MKLKTFSAPFTLDSINEEGHFRGRAATYDAIAYANELDVIQKGAFKRTVDHWKRSGKRMPFLYQHDTTEVLGSVIPEEDPNGLTIEGDFDLDTQLGREKYSLAKKGHITGLSIGFMDVPSKTEHRKTPEGIIRMMGEVKLYEVSLVTFPADETAQIQTIHESGDTAKEDWIKAKIEKLVGEGKSQEDAVGEAEGMWDEMQKGKSHAAKQKLKKHGLDADAIFAAISPLAQAIVDLCNEEESEPEADETADPSAEMQDDLDDWSELQQIMSLTSSICSLACMPVMQAAPDYVQQNAEVNIKKSITELEAIISKHSKPADPVVSEEKDSTQQQTENNSAPGEEFNSATAAKELAQVTRQFRSQYESSRTGDEGGRTVRSR